MCITQNNIPEKIPKTNMELKWRWKLSHFENEGDERVVR